VANYDAQYPRDFRLQLSANFYPLRRAESAKKIVASNWISIECFFPWRERKKQTNAMSPISALLVIRHSRNSNLRYNTWSIKGIIQLNLNIINKQNTKSAETVNRNDRMRIMLNYSTNVLICIFF